MPASPIRKLVPFANQAKDKGIKVFHLNIGQPDIPTPEVALNALRNINLNVIEYSHSAGNESYRRKLAQFYQKKGINVDHTQILVTTGGSVVEVMEIVKQAGGQVAGIGVLVDRSAGKVDFGVRKEAVLTMDIESWPPEACPLCQTGQGEAIKPGSRS